MRSLGHCVQALGVVIALRHRLLGLGREVQRGKHGIDEDIRFFVHGINRTITAGPETGSDADRRKTYQKFLVHIKTSSREIYINLGQNGHKKQFFVKENTEKTAFLPKNQPWPASSTEILR